MSPTLRRRTAARFALAALVTATAASTVTAAAGGAAAAPPGTGPAPSSPAESRTVSSGDARFEVLSPTLIRTEYAGDRHFVDASTFNVVGRDAFAPTRFTSRTSGGWLTIDTGAVQLRYRVGSGPFTEQNLTVSLDAGDQHVTAAPWPAPVRCTVGVRCEAEDLQRSGPGLATDHGGYSGSGFAAGFQATGDSLGFDVDVTTAGTYDAALRYANSAGGDGQNTTRTLSFSVDGGAPQQVTLPSTGSWDTWVVARVPLALSAGSHHLTLVRSAADSGNVNVDNVAVLAPGAAYPDPVAPAPQTCAFGTVCEADTGALQGGARLAKDHNGASGAGFLAGLERTTDRATLTVTGVPAAGTYAVQLRYANSQAGADPVQTRTVGISVDGAAPTTTSLPPTSSWDAWRTVSVPVALTAGTHTVAVVCPTDTSCHLNVDTLAVAPTAGPLLAPHAPLGGYRRGLDGVDAGALTAPGLLFQDGWSLLDDTASALWDPATKQVRQRAAHPYGTYQDGYVFGYGQDYARGLQDLSTLTGPTQLLPQWTYGTWWSEYYDRTADEFQAVVDRARAEHMPLDALVIDTDVKSPNQWNGWEIDPTRIPDPKAFFASLHAQDLHVSLNVHPSILPSDPKFAAAQATAGGTLAPGSCGGGGADCRVFDWGDPKQLDAYLGLHRDLEQDGVDFWWLDWCCDGASSSLPGVTPDSWINQQYADDTAPRTGRGFAFSRAYGSLQAGGYGGPVPVPTGPWADKRTTLHFTGDTISDWATMAFEVGYTPGESVATGEASISHDIGGHTGGLQEPSASPGATKLPDDLYARWVQLGTFQPIDRLHSNHSDRLPWQYGPAADASATAFLNLRERLVPYTYTLARQATATGTPIVRPLYLQYPDQQEAYAQSTGEYLYGPDVLVAPVTTPGTTATTSVWFPAGSTWTDWFTGRTYQGGTTAQISTDLSTMPVFVRSGGIVTTRTGDVANVTPPLTDVTLTVATGADGTSSLYEDDGTSADLSRSRTTALRYREDGPTHRLTVERAQGSYAGQVQQRAWTVTFTGASAPRQVKVDGRPVSGSAWSYDAATHRLTVHTDRRAVSKKVEVSYR